MANKISSSILTSIENGMLKITLNRAEKKNGFTISMYKDILQILQESINNNAVYAVILTGSDNFFSSGHDFHSSLMDQHEDDDVSSSVYLFKKFIDTLITYPKLLIAIVNGAAIGMAVTILPLFDMVYASDKAYFQTPFTYLGLTAEGCSTYTFPKIFGQSKAGDMLYLGYRMDAIEAKRYGFVSEVYKHEDLDAVWKYLTKLTKLSSESILAIKRLVKKWDQKTLLDVNEKEVNELINCMESSEFIERFLRVMSQKNKM